MKLHLTATGCHLSYGITQCYLPPATSEPTRLNPSQRPVLDLPAPEGSKAELTYVTGYMVTVMGSGETCKIQSCSWDRSRPQFCILAKNYDTSDCSLLAVPRVRTCFGSRI